MSTIYKEKMETLTKRYFKSQGGTDFNSIDFASWVVSDVLPNLSPSSWNLTKNTLKKFIDNEDALKIINIPCPNRKKDLPKSRSAQRKKHVTEDELRELCTELSQSRTKHGRETALLIHATILTGFRPSEWINAELSNHPIHGLIISTINAKQVSPELDPSMAIFSAKTQRNASKSGVSTKYQRAFTLNHLTQKECVIIENHYDYILQVRANANNLNVSPDKYWKKEIMKLTMTLYNCQIKLWPTKTQKINFYSCRHQFSANIKSSISNLNISENQSKLLISKLMGHSSKKSQDHYASLLKANLSMSYPIPIDIT